MKNKFPDKLYVYNIATYEVKTYLKIKENGNIINMYCWYYEDGCSDIVVKLYLSDIDNSFFKTKKKAEAALLTALISKRINIENKITLLKEKLKK